MNKSTPETASPDVVGQAKDAVTHVASDVAHQAREQLETQFESRKDKAVEAFGDIATALRDSGDKLQGIGPLGNVAGRAADGIEKVSSFFEGKNVGDIVREVEGFARREPTLFVGAALALGIVGGRFLKSSSHRASTVAGGAPSSRNESDYDRNLDEPPHTPRMIDNRPNRSLPLATPPKMSSAARGPAGSM